jgi:hypothetical protein
VDIEKETLFIELHKQGRAIGGGGGYFSIFIVFEQL